MNSAVSAATKKTTSASVGSSLELCPTSRELVIGLVGYAGAFSEKFTADLEHSLNNTYSYQVHSPIKLSGLIASEFPTDDVPIVKTGAAEGPSRLARASKLQDLGDSLRKDRGNAVLASMAIAQIIHLRGGEPQPNSRKAYIIDSLKHHAEVDLFREVYGHNFRLLAIHCSRDHRCARLLDSKYRHAQIDDIEQFLDRDEKDETKKHGQEVRKVFYIADFFVDNNQRDDGILYAADLKRFLDLLVGRSLIRPTHAEAGMYHAYAASLKSACLSRQVGAALQTEDGRIISVGTNEAPRFGGGIYGEDNEGTEVGDNRCFKWTQWMESATDGPCVPHCHNTRKKRALKQTIGKWLGDTFSNIIAGKLYPDPLEGELPLSKEEIRRRAICAIKNVFREEARIFDQMPGISDLIEYSRSIHAEMDAILNAARSGISPANTILYTTTFPCHNCARHIVAAGIKKYCIWSPT